MASESDDDAQAEKQVQMSLQCSAGHLVGPPHSEACEERPQFLHDTEVSGECGGAIGLLPKAQSSSNVAVAYSPKHCERSRSFEHADVLQLATSKFSGTGALQEDDAGRSSELRESTPHASHCCPAVHHSGSSPDVSSVVPESYLHAKRPSSHSDQDVSMKDVSSQAPIMDQITNEAVGTPATASPKAFTGTRSFTSMKPWSRFATSACSGSFKMYTISSALRFGSQWSSTERTGNKPSSSMLNQYIAQNQGSRLKLRHNGEGTYGIVETSNMLGQHVREPTPGSFETAREVRNTDHERDSSFRTGKQNDIFDGLHPDRLTMLSNGNALVPTAIPSESKGQGKQHGWKSTASNPRPLNTRQDIARAKKKKSENQEQTIADGKCSSSKSSSPKAEQHYLKNESNVAGFPTVGASLKFLPILETQFARKGIEYLKDRYPHLSSALPPGKEWSFAWQEIMTILRTTSSFDFIAWQGGFSVQLNTDFKVFRLRGPFQKKRGKAVITRRAVLHVIDGPYFFRRAAPALAEFCQVNDLGAPTYRHSLHPDGSYACSVLVRSESSVFGDDEEGYANREEATEDAAKKAMNALHREGVLMMGRAVTNPNQRRNKRKASESLIEEGDDWKVCSRIQKHIGKGAQGSRALRSIEDGDIQKDESNAVATVQDFNMEPSLGSPSSYSRTRAGLARVLEGNLNPRERVDIICQYLVIQGPQYWTEGYPEGENWSACFAFRCHPDQAGYTSIAGTTVNSAKGLQDCARLIEEKLLEKIYGGEIQLGDGGATFLDPAMDYERNRQHFANLRPGLKRRLEKDEGLTMEEIGRRFDGPDNLRLPPSANSMPLGVPKMPHFQRHGLDQDTGYESEDELSPNATILGESGHKPRGRIQPNVFDAEHFQPGGQLVALPRGGNIRSSSMPLGPARRRSLHIEDTAEKYLLEETLEVDQWPKLLPSGELPYVSPPPFLETSFRPLKARPVAIKPEPVQDKEDDEVVFVREHIVEDCDLSKSPDFEPDDGIIT